MSETPATPLPSSQGGIKTIEEFRAARHRPAEASPAPAILLDADPIHSEKETVPIAPAEAEPRKPVTLRDAWMRMQTALTHAETWRDVNAADATVLEAQLAELPAGDPRRIITERRLDCLKRGAEQHARDAEIFEAVCAILDHTIGDKLIRDRMKERAAAKAERDAETKLEAEKRRAIVERQGPRIEPAEAEAAE